MSDTSIKWDTFSGWMGLPDPKFPESITPFEFVGSVSEGGKVFSAVYPGAGAAAGKWVYIYQVKHYPRSGASRISAMSFRFPTNPDKYKVKYQSKEISSFEIIEGTPSGFGFGVGTREVGPVYWWPHPVKPTLEIDFNLYQNEITYIFGVFSSSSMPPKLVDAKLIGLDSVFEKKLKTSPRVYAPSPEPSVWMLLGWGLLCGLATRLQRRKK